MSIDGIDFKIFNSSTRTTKYYSYKINHTGLRYEVGLNIQTGDIVWTTGPYPPGEWTDIRIFLAELAGKLPLGEKVEADRGYRGWTRFVEDPTFAVPNTDKMRRTKALVRSRHEMVNNRFKTFGALKDCWRHDRLHHGLAFRCIAIVTQLSLETGHPLPQVEYRTMKFIGNIQESSEEEVETESDEESV